MAYTKEELTKMLRTGNYEISFTKKDGTTRKMKCTLKPEVIDEVIGSTNTPLYESTRKPNPDVMPVIDIENNGWRSFRLDSIIAIKEI